MDKKAIIGRLIAVLLLVIPGFIATYGFLIMKNVVFDFWASFGMEDTSPSFAWLPFLGGLVMFGFGVAFVGGWIFFRDRKRNYVAPRFMKKKKMPRPRS